MNAYATAAIDNAKLRLQIGWPLLAVVVALYAPADGLTRLLLLVASAALLVRAVPATGQARKKPAPAKPASPRPAPGPGPKPTSAKTTPASGSAPAPKVPSQRDGRWSK